MASPTIMQIVPRVETGGSEQSALEINAALAMAGARSIVVSEGGRLAPAIEAAGGINVILPMASKNPITILRNAKRLERLIERFGADLLHARSRAPAWSALLAARATGTPFVTTYHGSYNSRAPFKTLYNSVMARGDRVIANSRFTAEMVHGRHGTPLDSMPVIPRGFDAAAFDPEAVSADRLDALRRAWDVEPDRPIILQAARLTAWKGQPDLIEAVGRLKRQGALGRAVVVMAGSAQGRDAYERELRESIARLGIEDDVRIVGHCDDMPAAHALALVTVVASVEAETFGRASIEAQAMACPVIVTDIGAAPETFIAETQDPASFTGWLVPPRDPEALGAALGRVLELKPDARRSIGERARAHVRQRFSLVSMQRRTLAVYDGVLQTRLVEAFDAAVPKET